MLKKSIVSNTLKKINGVRYIKSTRVKKISPRKCGKYHNWVNHFYIEYKNSIDNPYGALTLPILRNFYPKLIAKELVNVMPIDKPSSKIKGI